MSKVVLIVGKLNAMQTSNFWIGDSKCTVGDYAVVENKGGMDLVHIVGVVETTKELAPQISNTKFENMKKVLLKINQKDLIISKKISEVSKSE